LLKNGSNVNVRDCLGATPLHLLADVRKGESTKCGEILVEWGVDVNMKNDSKRTPLHVASLRGHITLIEKLLKAPSILVEEQDACGMTPLHLIGSGVASIGFGVALIGFGVASIGFGVASICAVTICVDSIGEPVHFMCHKNRP
jgi:hypothetical protein